MVLTTHRPRLPNAPEPFSKNQRADLWFLGFAKKLDFPTGKFNLRIPMRTRIDLLFLVLLANTCVVNAQSSIASKPLSVTLLRAGRVLDVRSGHYIESAGILIEGDRIKEVGRTADIETHVPKGATVIDLGHATVLPGLVDCHTHLMARIPEHSRWICIESANQVSGVPRA